MSDFCRCPYCRGINHIDNRYCTDCYRAMWGPTEPNPKPQEA